MAKLILGILVYILCVVGSHAVLPARIIRGEDAPRLGYPYIVSIVAVGESLCGGTIIAPRFILTAAHCVSCKDVSSYVLRAGTNYLNRGGIVIRATKKIIHEGYVEGVLANDIALLELKKRLKYAHNILPIPLCERRIPDGKTVFIIGWGSMDGSQTNFANKLQLSTMTVAKRETCKSQTARILKSLLCLENLEDKVACYGDSGSPAVSNKGELVGIATFGIDDCHSPSIYADVSYYVDWIERHIDYTGNNRETTSRPKNLRAIIETVMSLGKQNKGRGL